MPTPDPAEKKNALQENFLEKLSLSRAPTHAHCFRYHRVIVRRRVESARWKKREFVVVVALASQSLTETNQSNLTL